MQKHAKNHQSSSTQPRSAGTALLITLSQRPQHATTDLVKGTVEAAERLPENRVVRKDQLAFVKDLKFGFRSRVLKPSQANIRYGQFCNPSVCSATFDCWKARFHRSCFRLAGGKVEKQRKQEIGSETEKAEGARARDRESERARARDRETERERERKRYLHTHTYI